MARKSSGRRAFGALRKLPSDRYQASYLGADGLRQTAPHTFPTKADAEAWLTLRQSELLRGEWLNPDLSKISFGNYAERWIAEHNISDRTRELYELLLRRHIRPFLGDRELGKISTDSVRAWRSQLLEHGRSADTTAKAYRLVRAVLNTAVDDGRIRRNPCRIKGADTVRRPERPTATIEQVYTLATAIGGRHRALVLAAAFTGLRWGELIALRRRDVNLDAGTVNVHRSIAELSNGRFVVGPPKSESGVRTVTLPAVLVSELRGHLDEYVDVSPEAVLFTGEKGATPSRGNWRDSVRWSAKVQATGLPKGFHFHDLRHTGNHLASLSGASTRELMHRMGHASMRAALVYQHATDARARQIAEQLSKAVEETLDETPDRSDEDTV